MGAVDQAVGEALNYYLEEHPKEAKMVVDKVILAAQARVAARKARESVQRKSPMSGGGMPGKLADCSSRILRNANCSWARVTRQVVLPSKAATVDSRLFCRFAVKS